MDFDHTIVWPAKEGLMLTTPPKGRLPLKQTNKRKKSKSSEKVNRRIRLCASSSEEDTEESSGKEDEGQKNELKETFKRVTKKTGQAANKNKTSKQM